MGSLFYGPLSTFEELMAYGEKQDSCSAMTINSGVSELCRSKTVPLLDKNFGNGKINFGGKAYDGPADGKHPLTLVCHDLKGGYGDDKYVNGSGNMENYAFRQWLLTDIFVYFSHKFVTIPTLGWINAAHSHGVKILGTIITEWDDGAELCSKILASEESINKTVQNLCKLCEDYGFDGYLLNVENKLKVDEGQVDGMVQFAKRLTETLKEKSSKNLVIWYDSVTKDGELKWQDCLNEKNKIFFDACDGIFLNYNWNDEKLKNSVATAGDRKYDVFVGVDCWGRGCWGGGGTNTCLAVDKISKQDLSYAIFAPGWTYETHHFKNYPCIDDEMWTKCMPNFHFRFITEHRYSTKHSNISRSNAESTDNNSSSYNNKGLNIYLATDFSRGYGKKTFFLGNVSSESPWFDLSKQSFQPIIFSSPQCLEYDCSAAQAKLYEIASNEKKVEESPSSALICEEGKIIYDTDDGFNGGGSLKILNAKQRKNFVHSMKFSPIWIPLNIPINSSRLSLAVILIWKSSSIDCQPHTYLEFGKENSSSCKILLGSLDTLADFLKVKYSIKLRLGHFLECLPGVQISENDDMEFQFHKNNFDEKPLNGWKVSCYVLDSEQVCNKYSAIKSIRIGSEGDVTLGFLSLGQIIHSDV